MGTAFGHQLTWFNFSKDTSDAKDRKIHADRSREGEQKRGSSDYALVDTATLGPNDATSAILVTSMQRSAISRPGPQ